jgi:type VI secretion system secreted protein Hcp
MPDNFDGFLKIDGVTSECKDPAHKDWIDVDSFSFGCSVADFAIGPEGKLKADDPSVQPITFTGGMHKGSPTLFQFCVSGKQIPTVEFHARTAGGEPFTYLQMKLADCLITGVSTSAGADGLPTETLTLAFRQIMFEYTEQDSKTGGPASGGTVSMTYDQAAHSDEEEA